MNKNIGDFVRIEPNIVFYYAGKMLLKLEMTPNFKDGSDHIVKEINYDTSL